MGSLGLLHGTAAIVVIAVLLFAEEAGIPLFFVSGDFVLLGAGVLVAAGAVNPWILVPVVALAVLAGALVAFAWSAALGARRLHSVALRLHLLRHLERAERRLGAAGPLAILVLRFVPGLRVYSTMMVGAMRIDLRTFLTGLLPSVLLWVVGFTLLGCAAGGPVEAAMTEIDHFGLEALGALAGAAMIGAAAARLRHRQTSRRAAA
jgi:membrane-associated protein